MPLEDAHGLGCRLEDVHVAGGPGAQRGGEREEAHVSADVENLHAGSGLARECAVEDRLVDAAVGPVVTGGVLICQAKFIAVEVREVTVLGRSTFEKAIP